MKTAAGKKPFLIATNIFAVIGLLTVIILVFVIISFLTFPDRIELNSDYHSRLQSFQDIQPEDGMSFSIEESTVSITEAGMAALLNGMMPAGFPPVGIDFDHRQIVLFTELNLEFAGVNPGMTARFQPSVYQGQVALQLEEIKMGSITLPKSTLLRVLPAPFIDEAGTLTFPVPMEGQLPPLQDAYVNNDLFYLEFGSNSDS